MRDRVNHLLALAAVGILWADPLSAAAQGFIPAEVVPLKNGLTAILHVDRRQPNVAVLIHYQIGARHEPPGRAGIAHLFEHLQFRGSDHMRPYSPGWYMQKCGVRGRNGTTSFDQTEYFEVVPKENLEPILWMESDRMGFPSLGALDLDEERAIVKNERRQRTEITAYGAARELLWKTTFPSSHPYHSMVIGDQAVLDKLKLSEAKDFFAKYYDPSNATLVIAGDIDLEQTKALVAKYFETLPSHGKPAVALDPKPIVIEKEVVLEHSEQIGREPSLIMQWLTPPLCTEGDVAAEVLSSILVRGTTGRIAKLKKTDGVDDVSVDLLSLHLQSVFAIEVSGKSRAAIAGAAQAIDQHIADLATKGAAPEELAAAKAWRRNQLISSLQQPMAKARLLAHADACFGTPKAAGKLLEQLEKVSITDIQQIAKMLVPQKRVSVFAMPTQTKAEVKP